MSPEDLLSRFETIVVKQLPDVERLLKNKVFVWVACISLVTGGSVLAIANWPDLVKSIQTLSLKDVGVLLIAFPLGAVALFVYSQQILVKGRTILTSDEDDNFLAVDRRAASRKGKDSFSMTELLARLEKSRRSKEVFNYDKIRSIVAEAVRQENKAATGPPNSFVEYFSKLVETLESKADVADEKASILLNKGTAYSRFGIGFFVVSIIAWQWLSWGGEFQSQFVYGILSCSVLFAFIEFLSAWFLRQYRHFVDTSTYLLRVKAVLDRYILAYFVANSQAAESGKVEAAAFTVLNQMLSEPIRWPETELFDKGTASFAKEAVDALSQIAMELRRERTKSDKTAAE